MLLRKLYLTASLMSLLSLSACVKNAQNADDTLVRQAHAFFVSHETASPNVNNYRARQPRTPLWDQASVIHLSDGDAIVVPILYRNTLLITSTASPNLAYRLSDLTKLIIQRDSQNQFHTTVLTFFPDSTTTAVNPSGIAFVEDWPGNSLRKPFNFGAAAKLSPRAKQTDGTKQTDVVQNIQVCNEIDGYNYSPDDPDNGTTWSETNCNTYTLPANTTGPTIGPGNLPGILGRAPIPLAVIITPPTNIIGNIQDYLKCFSNYGGSDHSYTVTLCVDQPIPGSRTPWALTSSGPSGSTTAGSPIQTGHSFLVLSENFSGYSIVRNVGFYPQTIITPWTPSAQGQLNDDEGHDYDISVTIAVDNGQFFNILNYLTLGNNPGFLYNLNSDNCTTFDLSALAAGGINLPSTLGSWVGGGFGYDPGDLGEDIRAMSLSSNMSRNTVSNPHPNLYTCN